MNIKLKYWFEWTNQSLWKDFAIFINHELIKLDGWNPALQVQKGNSQIQKQLEQQENSY